jgi:hypothetical protein
VADPHLGDLARRAGYYILVTPGAGPFVKYRSEPAALVRGYGAVVVLLFKPLLIQSKSIAAWFNEPVADALGTGILNQGWGGKTGWSFGCILLRNNRDSGCQRSQTPNEKRCFSIHHL